MHSGGGGVHMNLFCLVLRQELGGQLMQRQVNHLRFVNTQYVSKTFGRCAGHASCAVLRAITEGVWAAAAFISGAFVRIPVALGH